MSEQPTQVVERTIRTTAGLRETLFSVLDDLRTKNMTAQDAIAASKVASAIVNSITVEIEFHKHIGNKVPDGERLQSPTTLMLGVGEGKTWEK